MSEIKFAAKSLALFWILFLSAVAPASGQAPEVAQWEPSQVSILRQWIAKAPEDALPALSTARLDAAMANGDRPAIDREATALALHLARMQLLGNAPPSARAGWHIADPDAAIDLEARLSRTLADRNIDRFFLGLQPRHPDYAALRAAYAEETDDSRRKVLARNMERWRWMPRAMGQNYVLVNAARFEAALWKQGKQVGTWPVIVGKVRTPTPVFSATITGVILNPWWVVPASIVREMRGRFPASRGYVRTGGQIMQKPGPNNALGQMKLDMPNPYTVYMHDTPSKQLFEEETRAFSHGCIRVGNALDFATTLLEGVKTRDEVDAIVATRKTTKIALPASLPVYVTYFTAVVGEDGKVEILPDIYKRDARIPQLAAAGTGCHA